MDWAAIRKDFPVLERWVFLDHARVTALPGPVADAMATFLRQASHDGPAVYGEWIGAMRQAKELFAGLIGAQKAEVAFVKNTTHGLGIFANGVDWRPGDVIVTGAMEFPSNVYVWQNLERRGVQVRLLPDDSGRLPAESVMEACKDGVRAVAISWVQFRNGFRSDLEPLGRFCRENGILFVVDAIQGVGALPLDVEQCCVDFLALDAHKCLLGPEGIGFAYCSRRIMDQVHPATVGWASVARPNDFFNLELALAPSARRYEDGTPNTAGIAGLAAALALLHQVGMGAISDRIKYLTDLMVEGLRERSYSVLSPRGGGEWSGLVTFSLGGIPPDEVKAKMQQARIFCTVRGDTCRWSPHFYNNEDDVACALAALPPAG